MVVSLLSRNSYRPEQIRTQLGVIDSDASQDCASGVLSEAVQWGHFIRGAASAQLQPIAVIAMNTEPSVAGASDF